MSAVRYGNDGWKTVRATSCMSKHALSLNPYTYKVAMHANEVSAWMRPALLP